MTPDMKNIFDFATKELSQDAFLRWLFENYNCGDSQVRAACRRLFDSFTGGKLDFDKIENLKTVAQWKSIDVAIWFDIGDKNYLIVIEDKIFTSDHNNQLKRYEKAIREHNEWWRANAAAEESKKHAIERYIKDGEVFYIFYKTDVMEPDEEKRIRGLDWEVYDIEKIARLFMPLPLGENDLLDDYIRHIQTLHNAARHEGDPSKWELIAWHAFFIEYKNEITSRQGETTPGRRCPVAVDINHHQNSYFYIKFMAPGHEKDRPGLELRSRDYNAGEHTWHASVNVYSVDPRPSMEQIGRWQKALTDIRENIASRRTPGAPGEKDELTHTGEDIKLNHRKDPESFQQIGHISFPVEGDTGAALRAVLDRALDLFCDLYC